MQEDEQKHMNMETEAISQSKIIKIIEHDNVINIRDMELFTSETTDINVSENHVQNTISLYKLVQDNVIQLNTSHVEIT